MGTAHTCSHCWGAGLRGCMAQRVACMRSRARTLPLPDSQSCQLAPFSPSCVMLCCVLPATGVPSRGSQGHPGGRSIARA